MPLLPSDHDFDPETGDPIGWNRAKGDLVGLCFVLIAMALIVAVVVSILWFLVKVF